MLLAFALSGVLQVHVPGNPFMAVPTLDGRAVLVSVDSNQAANNGIAILQQNATGYSITKVVSMEGTPAGMALTSDGSTLLIAYGQGVAAVSTRDLLGNRQPVIYYLRQTGTPGTIEVSVSADGHFVFFSNERTSSIGVAKLDALSATATAPWHFVGFIPTDVAPVGLALSHDGRWLYATSEAGSSFGWCGLGPRGLRPIQCGSLRVIDAIKAETDPRSSVVNVVSAGSQPVRVAVSPDDSTAWVTERGYNHLVAFDTAALLAKKDPLRTTVSVGTAPVGLLLFANGTRAMVSDSNRFNPAATASQVEVIDTAAALLNKKSALTTIPTGSFPREIVENAARDLIFVTNYASDTVQIIPESMLP